MFWQNVKIWDYQYVLQITYRSCSSCRKLIYYSTYVHNILIKYKQMKCQSIKHEMMNFPELCWIVSHKFHEYIFCLYFVIFDNHSNPINVQNADLIRLFDIDFGIFVDYYVLLYYTWLLYIRKRFFIRSFYVFLYSYIVCENIPVE